MINYIIDVKLDSLYLILSQMRNYNYELSVKESILDRLEENEKPRILEYNEIQELKDKLYNEDSITGNMSGSYTCSTRHAKIHILEYLVDHETEFWDMIEDYWINMEENWNRWEKLDVLMRCWILENTEALQNALEERYMQGITAKDYLNNNE